MSAFGGKAGIAPSQNVRLCPRADMLPVAVIRRPLGIGTFPVHSAGAFPKIDLHQDVCRKTGSYC